MIAASLCECPRFAHKAHGKTLINHTYACLVMQRGTRTLDECYGTPAMPDPPRRNGHRTVRR